MSVLPTRLTVGQIWVLFGGACISLFFLFQSWILRYRFDPTYLVHLYERSQWTIPQSPRQMADAELYQVAGYDLWNGGSPFHVAPEVPALGKYLYGATIGLTGNPYLFSLFSFFLASFLLWHLTRFFWTEREPRQIALGLFWSSTLILAQLQQTMLDLPQLCGLLLHMIGVLYWKRSSEIRDRALATILAGLGIGLFVSFKIGVFAPAILLASLSILPLSTSGGFLALVGLLAGGTYLLSYLPAFVQGLTLLDWLRAQKWVFHFYTLSKLPRLPWMAPLTLLTGRFTQQGTNWSWVKEWTLWWPLATTVFLRLAHQRKNVSPPWRYALFVTTFLLIMMMITPFFPRYLLLVWPLLLLFLTEWLRRKTWLWHGAGLFLSAASVLVFLTPQPQAVADHLAERWQTGAFPEIHRQLTTTHQQSISSAQFTAELQNIAYHLESQPSVQFSLSPQSFWSTQATGTLSLKYKTPTGELTHQTPVMFVKEYGQWRLDWRWDLPLPQYVPGSQLLIDTEKPIFGRLIDREETVLSAGGEAPFIWIDPTKIVDSDEFLKKLETILQQTSAELQGKIYVIGEGQTKIPLGFPPPSLNASDEAWLKEHPAFFLETRPARVYHPDFVLIGPDEVAKHADLTPQAGGKVMLLQPDKTLTVLHEQPAIPGKDVKVDLSLKELVSRVQ